MGLLGLTLIHRRDAEGAERGNDILCALYVWSVNALVRCRSRWICLPSPGQSTAREPGRHDSIMDALACGQVSESG